MCSRNPHRTARALRGLGHFHEDWEGWMVRNPQGDFWRVVVAVEALVQAHLRTKDALAPRYIRYHAERRRGRYLADFSSSLDVPASIPLLAAAPAISFFLG